MTFFKSMEVCNGLLCGALLFRPNKLTIRPPSRRRQLQSTFYVHYYLHHVVQSFTHNNRTRLYSTRLHFLYSCSGHQYYSVVAEDVPLELQHCQLYITQ
jgi:hypothetical protein